MTMTMNRVIPFSTQQIINTQCADGFTLVYVDKMTERQASLMKDCQGILEHISPVSIVHGKELELLSPSCRVFVIPVLRDELVKRIRSRFTKKNIYTPRVVIEALRLLKTSLPNVGIAISMSMHQCHIFATQSFGIGDRRKISEMSGCLVTKFCDPNTNVLLAERADDKYCLKAQRRKIAVVSRDWLEKCYELSLSDDPDSAPFVDALELVPRYAMRAFHGLHFKISVNAPDQVAQIKRLILENQGKLVFGDESGLTHIVTQLPMDANDKFVSPEFVAACARAGRFLARKEFQADHHNQHNHNQHPQQQQQQVQQQQQQQDRLMPPPRPLARRSEMSDTIMRALNGFELGTQQTQLVSTQMGQLPEREIQIEQQVEPSQHIYWR